MRSPSTVTDHCALSKGSSSTESHPHFPLLSPPFSATVLILILLLLSFPLQFISCRSSLSLVSVTELLNRTNRAHNFHVRWDPSGPSLPTSLSLNNLSLFWSLRFLTDRIKLLISVSYFLLKNQDRLWGKLWYLCDLGGIFDSFMPVQCACFVVTLFASENGFELDTSYQLDNSLPLLYLFVWAKRIL